MAMKKLLGSCKYFFDVFCNKDGTVKEDMSIRVFNKDICGDELDLIKEVYKTIFEYEVVSVETKNMICMKQSMRDCGKILYGSFNSDPNCSEEKFCNRISSRFQWDSVKFERELGENVVDSIVYDKALSKPLKSYMKALYKLQSDFSGNMKVFNDAMIVEMEPYGINPELNDEEFGQLLELIEANSRVSIQRRVSNTPDKLKGYLNYLITHKGLSQVERYRLSLIEDILGISEVN